MPIDPALRIASRFVKVALAGGGGGDGEESGAKPSSVGHAPARWAEWLAEAHQGGKQKVPNPSPETQHRYKQVSYSTALRYKPFYKGALKEYEAWLKKQKDKPTGEDKPKSSEPKVKEPMKVRGELALSQDEIEEAADEHRVTFKALVKEMQAEVAKYTANLEKGLAADGSASPHGPPSKLCKELWDNLSEPEKMLHAAGHKIGEYYREQVEASIGDEVQFALGSWIRSPDLPQALQMCGALSDMGVEGYAIEGDTKKHHEDGKSNKHLKNALRDSVLFQRAFFEHIGLKEMTLYRGIKAQGVGDKDPPSVGDSVEINAREASSFSSDPRVAERFGRVIEFKVPVEHVLASNIVSPALGSDGCADSVYSEAEVIVMGASGMAGTIKQKHREKGAE